MSKELKRRGFRFVGPTICYSLMQACGLVNDHVVACFRYAEVGEAARSAPDRNHELESGPPPGGAARSTG